MQIIERASAARISSNLKPGRSEQFTDADVLIAAGLSGDTIFHEAQGAAGESGVKIVREMVGRIEGYVANTSYPARPVALQVVRELLLCKCLNCQGRGVIPASADGENEREHDCVVCLGSGLPKIDTDARARAAGESRYSAPVERLFGKVRDWIARREADSLIAWYRLTR